MDVDYAHYIKEYPTYTEKILIERKYESSFENPIIIFILGFIALILLANSFRKR